MNELVGRYYGTEEFIDYKADVEAPLPMIYPSGYLTSRIGIWIQTPTFWIFQMMR